MIEDSSSIMKLKIFKETNTLVNKKYKFAKPPGIRDCYSMNTKNMRDRLQLPQVLNTEQ